MEEQIDIFIFKKAKICPNASHKISFDNDNDIYNPFSIKNFALSSCIKNDELSDFLYEFTIANDLSRRECFNTLEVKMMALAKAPLSKMFNNCINEIFFQKIPLQCSCMKASMVLSCSCRLNILFHAVVQCCTYDVQRLSLHDLMIVDAYVGDA